MGDTQVNVTADANLKAANRSTTLNFNAHGVPLAISANQYGVPFFADMRLSGINAQPTSALAYVGCDISFANFLPTGGEGGCPRKDLRCKLNNFKTEGEINIGGEFSLLTSLWNGTDYLIFEYSYDQGQSWLRTSENVPTWTHGDYSTWWFDMGTEEINNIMDQTMTVRIGLGRTGDAINTYLYEWNMIFN